MDAPLPALRAYLKRLELDRVVIVQPSFYGTDNSCLLAALAELGSAARGVAVIDANITAAETERLHEAGIRGIRLNMASLVGIPDDAITTLLADTARVCHRNGWHIQLFMHSESIIALAKLLPTLGVPVVIDHFGLVSPHEPQSQALSELLKLLDTGHVWVKLSAPYRIAENVDSPNVGMLANRLAAANPDRIVWGSDWPHTPAHRGTPIDDDREMPYRDIDTVHLLGLVPKWFASANQRQALMVENPARLYNF
jgi:predicted TIM-barrel fold metal-dependent hydrolase